MSNLKRTRLFAAILLLPLVFSTSQAFPPPKAKNEIKFIYESRLIFVRVEFEKHHDLLFLLDTGASASAINLKTAQDLDLKFLADRNVEGSGGTIRTKTAKIRSLSVGGFKSGSLNVPAYDLSGSLAPKGMHLDGILGYDFLRRYSVEIDFATRSIKLSRMPFGNSKSRRSFDSVQLNLDNGIPRIPATLNGSAEIELRIDTGASLFETTDVYVNITQKTWNALAAGDPALKPEKYFGGTGVGGAVKLPVARINRFSVGPFTFSSAFVIVQPEQGYFARPDAIGFISNNLLEKLSPVVIDYLDRRLYFKRK
jgi:hypothetical protein